MAETLFVKYSSLNFFENNVYLNSIKKVILFFPVFCINSGYVIKMYRDSADV